jgi:hypothetical protein
MSAKKPAEQIQINFRGHNSYPSEFISLADVRTYWREFIRDSMSFFRDSRDWCQSAYINGCSVCGQPVIIQEVKPGSNKVRTTSDCLAPNGYPPFDVVLDCPSGKIVFGNDFRRLFESDKDEDEEYESIDSIKGIIGAVQRFEKRGMLHVFVSNTSPTVFQKGDTNLAFTTDFDEETDERKPPGEGYKEVSRVCTDLWWVSAMDYELFKKLCKEKNLKTDDLRPGKPLKVKPGKWFFNYNPMEGVEFTTCVGSWRETGIRLV